jgi:hypothetical protein
MTIYSQYTYLPLAAPLEVKTRQSEMASFMNDVALSTFPDVFLG